MTEPEITFYLFLASLYVSMWMLAVVDLIAAIAWAVMLAFEIRDKNKREIAKARFDAAMHVINHFDRLGRLDELNEHTIKTS